MFIVFMLSRLRRVFPVLAVVSGVLVLTSACEKVPLLAPTGSTITLVSAATALPFNGSTDIIAQVIEASGTPPHTGTRVTFTTTLGTIQPSEADTDISGRVTVKFMAGTGSGTATIAALSGGASASGTNAIKIAIGSAAVGGVSVTASPTSLSASGGSSTITAAVTDLSGNVLPNVPVTFTTDTGSLSASVANTGASGTAQTVLTTSKTAKVTATAGVTTTSGTTTTAAPKSDVSVTVSAAATVVFSSFSPAAPVAGQPVTFTLTITPATTSGAPIRQVAVNFGDGRSQTLGAVSGATLLAHTYDSPGTYTLTATATDTNGDVFVGVASISVASRPQATVAITLNPTSPQTGVSVAITVATTNLPTGTSVQGVSLDFGDGSPVASLGAQASATTQHVYQSPGTYSISAVVRDSGGGSSSSSTAVFVTPKPTPTVAFTVAPNPSTIAQQPVVLTAAVSGLPTGVTIDHYEWSFGDTQGRTTTSTSTSHVYTIGTWPASVTAVLSDGTRATSSTDVRVNP